MICSACHVNNNSTPALNRQGIKAILVMDNASYDCVPAEGSINVKAMQTKREVIEVLARYEVPYRVGRAPNGDNLDQLKFILKNWLKDNAKERGIVVGKSKVQKLCEDFQHFPPLMTPPYHPELQPIEKLWRDVKMLTIFLLGRTVAQLIIQVKNSFKVYASAEACSGKIKEALEWKRKYREEGLYAEVVDLTQLDDDDDDDDETDDDNDGLIRDDDSDDEAD
jgi:transposase